MAEVYSALIIVAVTLALSYTVYSQARFPVQAQPVYSSSEYEVYGAPSVLTLEVTSSAPSSVAEFRLDAASSLNGILDLSGSGYSTTDLLCGPGFTTFFSVYSGAGVLEVAANGATWIDGDSTASLSVTQGWHEVTISNSSTCQVTLPGGVTPTYPSSLLSAVPMEQTASQSFVFLVPFRTSGHEISIAFTGRVETYGF
ncbi:MAG: hypothetical protein LYZ69_00645 [Nitrososphaerales archaeon]|nr:hypothetical protein [Nitrososphaerales archaeon]